MKKVGDMYAKIGLIEGENNDNPVGRWYNSRKAVITLFSL
jgi:hypothetical protein